MRAQKRTTVSELDYGYGEDHPSEPRFILGHESLLNSSLMLAVVNANATAANRVALGKVVDAKRTVEKAPPAFVAKREWGPIAQDTSQPEHEGAYVQLSR